MASCKDLVYIEFLTSDSAHFLIPTFKSPENCRVFETNSSQNCISIENTINIIFYSAIFSKYVRNNYTNKCFNSYFVKFIFHSPPPCQPNNKPG